MTPKYIISLDQGTTSSRAVIFDKFANVIGMESKELTQIYPRPGWVEHDAMQIIEDVIFVLKAVLKKNNINPKEIAGIGITNQRETAVVWDKKTGKPIVHAIVWQCRRSSSICDTLKAKGLEDIIHQKTGLVVDAYFTGTKIKWILEHVDGAREKAEEGRLLAGTIDAWLMWNLTGGQRHVTDYSNASRTMFFNINSLQWDEEILRELNIPMAMLPTVVKNSGIIGELAESILGCAIPISGIAGDQQSALFGQACFDKGNTKNTYGTGCFILMNTGKKPVFSTHKLLTTIAWDLGEGVEYALEGSVFNAGASIQWLRDGLGLVQSASESEQLALEVEDTGMVYVVPAFTGLGAPYWDMYARGVMVGITRGTKKEHIVRATLEAIAYQSRDVLDVMKIDAGIEGMVLKVDGGASKNGFLMQFQADILNTTVQRPQVIETTALGAAFLAGLGTGFWKNKDEIRSIWAMEKVYTPKMQEAIRVDKYSKWKKAVQCSMGWAQNQSFENGCDEA